MTIEEKAKAYDEAIEKAKKELNTCGSQDCDAARQIFRLFPELKSEDERLRKEIISALKYANHKGVYDKHLYWLEKQGEQKPYSQMEKCINCQFNYTGYCNGTCILKSNKQKPAWREEDEIGLSDALWAIKQARTIAKDENDMGNLWYAEDWLKSLKDRFTWKPSDEQIKVCKEVYANFLSAKGCNVGTVNSEINRLEEQLKKLREE